MKFKALHIDKLLEKTYSEYKLDYKADNDYFGIYDTHVDEINQGQPTGFSIPGHTTVGDGYQKFKVSYQYTSGFWWWKKTKTKVIYKDYALVKLGWGSNDSAYYPKDTISLFSNLLTKTTN